MDKESAFSCQKGTFASGRGITRALKGAGMSAKGAFPCQKGVFAGGRAAIYAKKGVFIGEKGCFMYVHTRKASSLTEGASYLVKRAHSCAERALFRTRRAPLLAEGAPYLLRGCRHRKKTPFCVRRAPLLAGKRPYYAFGAKIDTGPGYSANGDKSWCPCVFNAVAPTSIGEWLPAPAAPMDPPLTSYTAAHAQRLVKI